MRLHSRAALAALLALGVMAAPAQATRVGSVDLTLPEGWADCGCDAPGVEVVSQGAHLAVTARSDGAVPATAALAALRARGVAVEGDAEQSAQASVADTVGWLVIYAGDGTHHAAGAGKLGDELVVFVLEAPDAEWPAALEVWSAVMAGARFAGAQAAPASDEAPAAPAQHEVMLFNEADDCTATVKLAGQSYQLAASGATTVALAAGSYTLSRQNRDGSWTEQDYEVPAWVRFSGSCPAPAAEVVEVRVENHGVGCVAEVWIDGQAVSIPAGEAVTVEVAPGDHELAWQSSDGALKTSTVQAPSHKPWAGACVAPKRGGDGGGDGDGDGGGGGSGDGSGDGDADQAPVLADASPAEVDAEGDGDGEPARAAPAEGGERAERGGRGGRRGATGGGRGGAGGNDSAAAGGGAPAPAPEPAPAPAPAPAGNDSAGAGGDEPAARAGGEAPQGGSDARGGDDAATGDGAALGAARALERACTDEGPVALQKYKDVSSERALAGLLPGFLDATLTKVHAGTACWQAMKDVVSADSRTYLGQGPALPVAELAAKGGVVRYDNFDSVCTHYRNTTVYPTKEACMQAAAEQDFDSARGLDVGKAYRGKTAESWWAANDDIKATTIAELKRQLHVTDAFYDQGAVKFLITADGYRKMVAAGNTLHKPTAYDGLFQASGDDPFWVRNDASPFWGKTKGVPATHEVVLYSLAVSAIEAERSELYPDDIEDPSEPRPSDPDTATEASCKSPVLPTQVEAGKVRLGSWNVRNLGWGTRTDLDAVASVIEDNFDVVAVLEVMAREGRAPGHEALRQRLGAGWSSVITPTPRPESGSHREYYAIFYRPAVVSPCATPATMRTAPGSFARPPAYTCFRVAGGERQPDFVVGAFHAIWKGGHKPTIQAEARQLGAVFRDMSASYPDERDLFLLGDFNLTRAELSAVDAEGNRFDNWGLASSTTLSRARGGEHTGNAYDHFLLADRTAIQEYTLEKAQALDVRCAARSPQRFVDVVSDHLPIRALMSVTGADDDGPRPRSFKLDNKIFSLEIAEATYYDSYGDHRFLMQELGVSNDSDVTKLLPGLVGGDAIIKFKAPGSPQFRCKVLALREKVVDRFLDDQAPLVWSHGDCAKVEFTLPGDLRLRALQQFSLRMLPASDPSEVKLRIVGDRAEADLGKNIWSNGQLRFDAGGSCWFENRASMTVRKYTWVRQPEPLVTLKVDRAGTLEVSALAEFSQVTAGSPLNPELTLGDGGDSVGTIRHDGNKADVSFAIGGAIKQVAFVRKGERWALDTSSRSYDKVTLDRLTGMGCRP